MRPVGQLLLCSGMAAVLLGGTASRGQAEGTDAGRPVPAKARIQLVVPLSAQKHMAIVGDTLEMSETELRARGDVTITFSGGFRLQVSQMLVRIAPIGGDGERTIT